MRLSEVQTADVSVLVEKAQNGDVSAFEQLYRLNLKPVYSLCYRLTADHSIAEELTQEAFLRVWQKLTLFHAQSAFSTWMYRLVTNVVLASVRKRNLIDHQSPEELDTLHSDMEPEQAAHINDLEKALLSLSNGARQVFVLHDIEGYTHTEIAELLGIATGTSKTQLHRARKQLQEIL